MKKLLLVFCLLLSACGSGASDPAPVAVVPNPNAVVAVQVVEDYRKDVKDDFQPYLVNVTFRTTTAEYNVEYCDTEIKVGDVVSLEAYDVGTTLIYVNDVMVGNIIDWEATEKEIANHV